VIPVSVAGNNISIDTKTAPHPPPGQGVEKVAVYARFN